MAFNTHGCSDLENPIPGEKSKRKERSKIKRKKTIDKQAPKLTIINIEQQGEVVECQMETAKHPCVSFKFNRDDDEPGDIAQTLVSWQLYVASRAAFAITDF